MISAIQFSSDLKFWNGPLKKDMFLQAGEQLPGTQSGIQN